MAKLSCVAALVGSLLCLVEGATFIVGTTKPVTGSKAHRRALAARDDGGGIDGLLGEILDLDGLLSGSGLDSGSVFYHYSNSATGFAAPMTQEQADTLAQHPDVLYVKRDSRRSLLTTRAPQFLGIEDNQALLGHGRRDLDLGLSLGLDAEANLGDWSGECDMVIGVVDSGAWPELPSYNDEGLGPPPAHWKGGCVEGPGWTKDNCNNKLIGAKPYYQGYLEGFNLTAATANDSLTARDVNGHGTHTSTTAAGARVPNASLFGQANGTARGMAVGARIAVYRVCFGTGDSEGCFDSDFIAAMDDAIEDGVNVLSLSESGSRVHGIDPTDSFVQAAFRARQKGILFFNSFGNSGPRPFHGRAGVPWIFSVGASTLDRNFPAVAVLTDGTSFTGVSIPRNESDPSYKPLADGQLYDFVLGSQVGLHGTNVSETERCYNGTLDGAKVAGKIVICKLDYDGGDAYGLWTRDAGAAGMVIYQDLLANDPPALPMGLPATFLNRDNGLKLVNLVKAGHVQGTIDLKGTVYDEEPAPQLAEFSARGPCVVDFGILKPDIIGPGVGILAGWTGAVGPTGQDEDHTRTLFASDSGTSMSCPVLAGLSAYVKARRPDFTASMVHSALMTTAYTTTKGSSVSTIKDRATGADTDPFGYGSGHVDPVRALNPGLVYDITIDDFIRYGCGQNSSATFVSILTGGVNTTCDKPITSEELNHPSFAAVYDTSSDTGTKEFTFPRTLTSVYGGGSQYTADISMMTPNNNNPLVTVSVVPDTLTFTGYGDQQSFVVKVSMQANKNSVVSTFPAVGEDDPESTYGLTSAFARLTWSDGEHTVGSSLAFSWFNVTAVVADYSDDDT